MRFILIALILALVGGPWVAAFAVGFIRGPEASQSRTEVRPVLGQVLHPLSRVATIYGRFLVLYLIAELFLTVDQSGQFPRVCGNTPYSTSGADGSGVTALRGASLKSDGTVQVCTAHPTAYEWFLYALIRLPNLILWGTVLVLVWQLIRQAARRGPFSQQSAAIIHWLGLVVLAGTAIAAAISALGADLMDRVLLVHPGLAGGGIALDVLIYEPLRALVPWPALAGAALLSFVRITRVGIVLAEEVRATV